jgi:tricorn protease
MDANGGGARQLTSGGKNNLRPAWSPDGREIAFTSDRDGSTAVWIVPVDRGGEPRRISAGEGWDAAWSRPQ